MAKNTVTETNTVASIPLPSADLINYRFDQNDRQFDKLNKKLDDMTMNFVTQAYITKLEAESELKHKDFQKQIDDIKKNAKWWVTTIVAIAAVVVAAVAIFHQ